MMVVILTPVDGIIRWLPRGFSCSPNVEQLNIQKYVLQDGDIAWQAEFFADEEEQGECLPMLSGEAAQSVFDGDYDEIELRQEWLEENTLHEWDEGEFQLEPSLDTEEGQTAADEWDER